MFPILSGGGTDDDGGGVHSPFGLLKELDPYISTLAFIAVILFTILFEVLRHKLDIKLKESPYGEMVKHVYEELTVLGFISFGVFLAIYAGGLDQHARYFEAFEFAHIIVFFLALFFILQSASIITAAKIIKKRYDQAVVTGIQALTRDYDIHSDSKLFRLSYFFPLSKVRTAIEFKIFQIFFIRCYKLPRDFVYADYLSGSLNNFIIQILNIDISSWICMIALLLLNLIRIDFYDDEECKIKYDASSSSSTRFLRYLATDDHSTDDNVTLTDDHVTDDHVSHACYQHVSVDFMIFVGLMILIFSLFLLYMIRRSERKLLKKAGCLGQHDYKDFLVDAYLSDWANVHQSGRKQSQFLIRAPTIFSLNEIKEQISGVSPVQNDIENQSNKMNSKLQRDHSAILDLPNLRKREYEEEVKSKSKRNILGFKKSKKKIYSESSTSSIKLIKQKRIKLKMNLKDIYIFHSPFLFYKSLDIVLLIACLYWALCSTNYFILALDEEYGILRAITLGVLGLLAFPINLSTVMTASRLQSIAQIDTEVLAKVIEETEERRLLKKEFIDKVREKMEELGVGRKGLVELFDRMDEDSSGEISKKEFKNGLGLLDIHYSKEKFAKIFQLMDRSGDQQISLIEFSHFIYPMDGNKQEYQGIKKLKEQSEKKNKLNIVQEENEKEVDSDDELNTNVGDFEDFEIDHEHKNEESKENQNIINRLSMDMDNEEDDD